jgi:hypothetical protein
MKEKAPRRWSERKRSSLHIYPELNDRIDIIMWKLRKEMKIDTKKNHLMEKWVEDGVDFMENQLGIKKRD